MALRERNGRPCTTKMQTAVKCKKSVRSNPKTKALWSLKEAKDKGLDFSALRSVQKIQTRSQVSLNLWAIQIASAASLMDKGTSSRGRVAILDWVSWSALVESTGRAWNQAHAPGAVSVPSSSVLLAPPRRTR